MKFRSHLALTFLFFGFAGMSAHAQDFYRNTASASSVALGGVYVPSSDGALDALSANPAGLTYLGGRTLDLSLTSEFARGSFTNSVNNNAPMTTSPGAIPYGAFGTPIGHSRFSMGVGFIPDLLSVSDWNYVDAPGAAGATYGLQKQKSAILAARSVAGLSFAINKQLSIGATVGAEYNSNTLEAPYIFQIHPVLAGLKTLLNLHTNGIGWNTSIGLLAQPSRKVQFGVAWKSRTVIDSTGTATGNLGAQFAAAGIPFRPDFQYSAMVQNVLPQSVLASIDWHLNPRWMLAFQTDFVNWKDAFVTLPVTLTNGSNSDINSFLKSSSIIDGVPLNWNNQFSYHAGVERMLTESTSIRGGFAHANNPVPGSTVMPLTAAIMSNQLSTGVIYRHGRSRFELAYAYDLTGQANVKQSALLSGEYNNSTVRVGAQSVTLNTSIRF